MSKLRIGNVEVQPVLDATALMDPHYMFPQVADQMLAEHPELIVDERQLMNLALTCFLVRSGGKTIIVDTGVGPRKRSGLPRGNLDVNLKEAGVAREEIDFVVHTHLHSDHVGWNTIDTEDGEREIFFPNARFVIQRAEWDYWMQPEKVNGLGNDHLKECVEPLRNSDRLDFVDTENAFDENITFLSTPGHTPGHVAIGIYSQGERAVIVGDASHHPAQLAHPDWSPRLDIDPVQSAETRDRLFDECADDGRTWIAGHWPTPGIGRIVRLDGKRVFQAL